MFWSIAQALNSYRGDAYGMLWSHLALFGFAPGRVTCTDLRKITYSVFLVPNKATDDIIDTWRAMLTASAELSHEYQQAKVLPDKPAAELTRDERRAFYDACMNPALCWGEETALVFLEQLLCIRCLVVTKKVLQTRQYSNHPDTFQPIVFIPISLSNMHYQSITWFDEGNVEHTAFAEHELPDVFLFLSQRDCNKAPQPFVNLKHRIDFRATELAGEATGPYPIRPPTPDRAMLHHFAQCRELL